MWPLRAALAAYPSECLGPQGDQGGGVAEGEKPLLQTEGTGLSPASEQDPSSPLGAALRSALKSSPVASSVVLAQTLRMPCGGLRGAGGSCVLHGQAE